jgi:hypothetical protein
VRTITEFVEKVGADGVHTKESTILGRYEVKETGAVREMVNDVVV